MKSSRLAAFASGIVSVVACTLVDGLLFGRVHDESLVMVYMLGLVPVALLGDVGAALLTVLLAVAAFDFFFTVPYHSLWVDDPRYWFTFAVMAVVGAVISVLTARLAHALATSQDRTEEAEALGEELRRANQGLATLDRLKADLLNNVSHELRTPLSAIEGNLEMLQDRVVGPMLPAQVELVTRSMEASKRLERMVDFLVDFARLESGAFTFDQAVIDLRDVVAGAVAAVSDQAREAGLQLEVGVPASPVEVLIDAQRVHQVLLNLLDNAIKFTRPGGHIDVTLATQDGGARLSVRDTGIGIAAAHLPRIFEKFYQVDPSSTRAFGGAGLGLSFSKALVEAQGGRLMATSEPGKGSTFTVMLPLARAATAVPDGRTVRARRR